MPGPKKLKDGERWTPAEHRAAQERAALQGEVQEKLRIDRPALGDEQRELLAHVIVCHSEIDVATAVVADVRAAHRRAVHVPAEGGDHHHGWTY